MKRLELDIGEEAYKKLRREVMAAGLSFGEGMDLKTKALVMMFRAWDKGEIPSIKSKEDVDTTSENH